MSDNKLLTENTIRRFMKLANVGTLTNNFLAETQAEEKDNNETIGDDTRDATASAKKLA